MIVLSYRQRPLKSTEKKQDILPEKLDIRTAELLYFLHRVLHGLCNRVSQASGYGRGKKSTEKILDILPEKLEISRKKTYGF